MTQAKQCTCTWTPTEQLGTANCPLHKPLQRVYARLARIREAVARAESYHEYHDGELWDCEYVECIREYVADVHGDDIARAAVERIIEDYRQ